MDDGHFSDEALRLKGYVGGNCPVQGEGRVFGFPFYFRARGQDWTCAIYLNRDHPCPENFAGAEPSEHDVFFEYRGIMGYAHYGCCEDGVDAGWMPVEEAKQLIRNCAAAFISKMARTSLVD